MPQLLVHVAGVENLKLKIGTRHVTGDDAEVAQMTDDVASHAGRCRRCHSQHWRITQCLSSPSDREVVRSKIMAPHADAVCFVDYQSIHTRTSQRVQEGWLAQSFRSGVD